ncbi:type IV pilus twitching motility protein PilT [Haliovirga abyssi]|uniref:Twitching motility protein PilT n=1 Tax=Haliovirga abyssi TaxID=2996794 RepID=A0AAU9D5M7_9FUSO|nr:type IV pilus twitching motility protein PilT [Haliovirga abyssi]BDU49848.1 twitching motility protein PilT [Haliovirga abyssi]
MEIREILERAEELKASDIHIVAGKSPILRVHGELQDMDEERLMPSDCQTLIYSILSELQQKEFEESKELDFSFGIAGLGRYRVNVHMQRGTVAAAIRTIATDIPPLDKLGLPKSVEKFSDYKNGLVLVTGPTGSGKSTTLAAIINKINEEKSSHIITIEDPIEYLHRHKKSIVEQREVKSDTSSFATALKYALRQDPDVILIGELRDLETIEAALTAAETGHLVFGTLHTNDAAQTIDRIVDVFPTNQQPQIRILLSSVIKGVVSQQLIQTVDKKSRVLAAEVLVGTPAVSNLIREAKTHQIYSMIETGARFGMRSMDMSLKDLYERRLISYDDMVKRMRNPNFM